MVNEEHVQRVAKELGLKIEFNSENPGVLNTTTGELRSLESYFGIPKETRACLCGGTMTYRIGSREFAIVDVKILVNNAPHFLCETCKMAAWDSGVPIDSALLHAYKNEYTEIDLDEFRRMEELREEIQRMNKDIPILKAGKNGAIELDPCNPSHREWFENDEDYDV